MLIVTGYGLFVKEDCVDIQRTIDPLGNPRSSPIASIFRTIGEF